jgi:hypothetical protein
MAGECCDEGWYSVDEATGYADVVAIGEVEPASLEAAARRVCASDAVTPAAAGSLPRAPVQVFEPGYEAEWFVAPGTFNMPMEVMVTPSGELLVQAVRASTLFRMTRDGEASVLAHDVLGYLGVADAQGNVYLYHMPTGSITKITPEGYASVLVESQELRANCTSAIGMGPDGNLYVARSTCTGSATLLRVTTRGRVSAVREGIPQLQAMCMDSAGRFLAAGEWQIYSLSTSDFSLDPLGAVPGELTISPGGLTADREGSIYVSTGARKSYGEIYSFDRQGRWARVAYIPGNGLSGIGWLAETQEVVGGQLRQGGVIAVSREGVVRTLVAGNGIVTPMGLAFSPCGELAVVCDDGGMMALVTSDNFDRTSPPSYGRGSGITGAGW